MCVGRWPGACKHMYVDALNTRCLRDLDRLISEPPKAPPPTHPEYVLVWCCSRMSHLVSKLQSIVD